MMSVTAERGYYVVVGVIQACSNKDKNALLFESVKNTGQEAINFGIFEDEIAEISYVQTAFLVSLLLESKAVDFVVTGCSSGQGMALACNAFPGVLCGYVPTPQDAYLFGRINGGNAASFPLGLNFGWCGSLNLQNTMDALFKGPFGMGYPPEDAQRKQEDTSILKNIIRSARTPLCDLVKKLDPVFVKGCLVNEHVYQYIMDNSPRPEIKALLNKFSDTI